MALLLHAALVVALIAGPADDGLGDLVRSLGAEGIAARTGAERALAGALPGVAGAPRRRADFVDEVADALAGPGRTSEAGRRLTAVLGADDRLLGLAIELASAAAPDAARVGRDAIRAHLERWSLSAFDEPETAGFDPDRRRYDPPGPWRDRATLGLALDPTRGGLLGAFDRLDRHGGGPAPIVVDPRLAERAIRRPAPVGPAVGRIDGDFGEVLVALCRVHDAGFQLQSFRYPRETRPGDGATQVRGDEPRRPARAWIHVVPGGTVEMDPVGRELRIPAGERIVGWCVDAARPGNLARQAAAARALAALEWPAAIAWLELRWLETGDVPALDGLLAAAARGRVAPSLRRVDVIERILGLVDAEGRATLEALAAREAALAPETIARTSAAAKEASARLDGRAMRFAVGLAELGAFVADAGGVAGPEAATAALLDGFQGAPPTGRWVRLVALEGMAAPGAYARAAAESVFRGAVDARSRRQGLRTLLTVTRPGASPVTVADPGAFLASARPDLAGLGLELGLVPVEPLGAAGSDERAAHSWIGAFGEDPAAVTELLVWAALADEARVAREGASAPLAPWVLEVARRAARLARDARPGRGADPVAKAAREARGGLATSLGALTARARQPLGLADGDALARAALRAGVADDAMRREALAGARATLAAPAGEVPGEAVEGAWRDLAALVADEALGEAARSALTGAILTWLEAPTGAAAGTTMELVGAAEAAAIALRSARRDGEVEAFLDPLREAAVLADHPVAGLFLDADWPAPVRPVPRDIELLAPPLPPR